MTRTTQPKTSIGSKRSVEVSICLWIDLLGYGSMLRCDGFDVTKSSTKKAVERLFRFQDIVAKHSMKLFPTVVLNDGCVAYRDLSPRSKSVTYDFLKRAYELHSEINAIESSENLPGVRSILAVGLRHRRLSDRKTNLISGVGARLIESEKNNKQTTEQAILAALSSRSSYDLIPELQANFAFTKAYLADCAGKKGGFEGPNFFVDANMIPDDPPTWLKIKKTIELNEEGIGGNFYQLTDIDAIPNSSKDYSLLDAFEVAVNITKSEDVIKRMQNLTLSGEDYRAK
jgi:hypothetical protein